jgi:4-methyl-5(b-hydroxyethyl)-thiazole monophosphate biosynthesis
MSKVLVPLAQGCEELEAVTIIDILRRAGIEVVTAGLDDRPVTAAHGTALLPDTTLDRALADGFDMVVLPGGLPGSTNLADDPRVIRLVQDLARAGKYTAAICAAPTVLAKAGVLSGKRATSYPGFLEAMELSDVRVENTPVVVDGKVVTSRGPGTAMDFALELVRLLAGNAKRHEVEGALQRPGA